jgi:hypothetical protein
MRFSRQKPPSWFDRSSGPSNRTRAYRLKLRKDTFMTTASGALAPTPRAYDQEAFDELAAQADRADAAFALDAIDRGLERLVDHPNRATSGKRLARRLVRDAKKHLRTNRRGEILTDTINKADSNFNSPTATEFDDVRRAVLVIRAGLLGLGSRDLLVLMTKANGGTAEPLTVKARQYRNLVATARERLWLQPGVALACELVMDALGRWRYETLELMTPLSDSIPPLN